MSAEHTMATARVTGEEKPHGLLLSGLGDCTAITWPMYAERKV